MANHRKVGNFTSALLGKITPVLTPGATGLILPKSAEVIFPTLGREGAW